MLVCAKLAFKGRYILVLVFQGSFYDGQAALCFYMWLYVRSFLLKLLSVVFNLSAKLNEVKKLGIIKMMPRSQKLCVSFTFVKVLNYS